MLGCAGVERSDVWMGGLCFDAIAYAFIASVLSQSNVDTMLSSYTSDDHDRSGQ
jgi:hypothetical protein